MDEADLWPAPEAHYSERPGHPTLPLTSAKLASSDSNDGPRKKAENPSLKCLASRHWRSAYIYLKLISPPLAVSLFLIPFVLVGPVRRWMGEYSFLCYVFFYLFFFPSPLTVGKYFEAALLSILAAAIGLAICFLAVSGTIWIDGRGQSAYQSPSSRAVGVCTLVFIAFVSGVLSSAIPRFKAPSRCCLFAATWALTSRYTEIASKIFTDLFYPILVAAIVGLLVSLLVFPRTARRTFIQILIDILDTTCKILEQAVNDFFGPPLEKNSDDEVIARQHGSLADSGHVNGVASRHFGELQSKLLGIDSKADGTFNAAENETTFSRISVDNFKGFLPFFRTMRAWVACGMGLETRSKEHMAQQRTEQFADMVLDDKRLGTKRAAFAETLEKGGKVHVDGFEAPVRKLCHEAVLSLQLVKISIQLSAGLIKIEHIDPHSDAWHVGPISGLSHLEFKQASIRGAFLAAAVVGGITNKDLDSTPDCALQRQKKALRTAIATFKNSFGEALKGVRKCKPTPHQSRSTTETPPSDPQPSAIPSYLRAETSSDHPAETGFTDLFRKELYAVSFLMVSLLEIAMLAEACLRVSQGLLRTWHAHPSRRFHWPVIKWKAWLNSSDDGPTGQSYGDFANLLDDDSDTGEDKQTSSYFDHKTDKTLWEWYAAHKDQYEVISRRFTPHWFVQHAYSAIIRFSRAGGVLKIRMMVSRRLQQLRHSRHIKFGIKLAAGVGLLSFPAWLGPGDVRGWWYRKRGQWMVISFLYCLETSTGASFRVSLFRVFGTFFGSLLGYVISVISNGNPYALAFLQVVACVPAAHFMLFTKAEGVGIVMGLTTPIISLIPALELESGSESVVELAWNRGYMITLGIFAALIMNLLIWPLHARVELVRKISRCTRLLESLYLSLSRQMLTGGFVASAESSVAFEAIENSIERKIAKARALVSMMEAEITLIPKRTDVLSQILTRLQSIAELLRGLRRCREHGLRSIQQEAVINVLEMRQNVIASVLIILWSTGQALLTHSPLPQFLPSPRLALAELTAAVAEQLNAPSDLPDAYHALASLPATLPRHRKNASALHSLQSPTPGSGVTTPPRSASTPRKRDYASFFILAEHALLCDIVASLEVLVELTRTLVGEASFLQTSFVPKGEEAHNTSMSLNHALSLQRELAQQRGRNQLGDQPPETLRTLFHPAS